MFKPKLDGPAILREVRRVAHVENVGVRGLVLPDAASAALAAERGVDAAALVLSCFYTLSLGDEGAEPYYTSPLALPSLSPTWPPVRPAEFAREVPWTARRLVVRVYGVPAGRPENPPPGGPAPLPSSPGCRLLITQAVNVGELCWLRPADTSSMPELPPSALLLFLPDGAYAPAGSAAAAAVQRADARASAGRAAPPRRSEAWRLVTRRANESATRRARTARATVGEALDGASLVFEAGQAAEQAEARTRELGAAVEAALNEVPASEEARRLRAWRERLAALEARVEAEELELRAERDETAAQREARAEAARLLAEASRRLDEERRRAREDLAARRLEAAKARLGAVEERLAARQRRMIHALAQVYPIARMGGSGNTNASHTIRGQRLPASGLASLEDELVSTALGYAAHLVVMVAKYLEVPLRYTVLYRGSRSAVRDDVHGFPEYPLYTRGEDTLRFDYAARYLTINAAHLLRVRAKQLGRAPPRTDDTVLGNLSQLVRLEVPAE